MEIRLLERDKEKGKLSFILKDTDAVFVNALRRAIMEEVPTMAIEDVEIRKNSSILYDEVIAHRLGLLPLSTDLKAYNLPEKCKCEGKGCARCQLKMTLKAKGPLTVYASDIKTRDAAVKPLYPKTPVVNLLKNQMLELEATAVLGKGKTHTKWSPALAYYKNKPLIEINAKCDGCGNCIEQCPVNIFELQDKKSVINKDNALKCHLCSACVDSCKKEAVKVEQTNDFIFTIESWGQLGEKEAVVQASKIVQEKADDFAESLKK